MDLALGKEILYHELNTFNHNNNNNDNKNYIYNKHLADKIAQKDTEPYHVVITWLRTQISFELLRSVHACVRDSRTPFRSKIEQSLDCKINVASADI